MRKQAVAGRSMTSSAETVAGNCLCGAVEIEIGIPAFWAWHDHSRASQRAQGCAYATYIGCWRSKVRIVQGSKSIARYEDAKTRAARSFCVRCGTPLLYERAHAPQMVNIPRALFGTRTGREPRYHLSIEEAPEWEYHGEALVPLKGYPGVLQERPRRKKTRLAEGMF